MARRHHLLGMATLLATSEAQAFHYFEHKWLGEVACAAARAQSDRSIPCTIRAPSGRELTFGDMVALAADHFGSARELQEAILMWSRGESEDDSKLARVLLARDYQATGVRGWLEENGRKMGSTMMACRHTTTLTIRRGTPSRSRRVRPAFARSRRWRSCSDA